jgi:transposase
LVCQARGDDVWVRLGPSRACYSVDSPRELVNVIAALMRDDAHFVLLSKQRKWSGTTLVPRGARPAQRVGESARIISWSGKFDRRLRAPRRPRPYTPA